MDEKNGYCILNPGICKIDYKGTTEIKRINSEEYRCICRNRNSTKGFYETNKEGNYQDGGDLLCCYFCGRIFNKNTLEIIRGICIR